MALSEATKEAMYLRRFPINIGFNTSAQVRIFCDNNGARKLAENLVFHIRSKHIDIRHHFFREVFERGELEILYTPTGEMAADVLTKGTKARKVHETPRYDEHRDVDDKPSFNRGKVLERPYFAICCDLRMSHCRWHSLATLRTHLHLFFILTDRRAIITHRESTGIVL